MTLVILTCFASIFALLVFILGLVNVKKYLINQKKYRSWPILIFYIVSFLAIGFSSVALVFYPTNYLCSPLIMVSGFGASIMNLIIGICQANVLTTISIQLSSLFRYT